MRLTMDIRSFFEKQEQPKKKGRPRGSKTNRRGRPRKEAPPNEDEKAAPQKQPKLGDQGPSELPATEVQGSKRSGSTSQRTNYATGEDAERLAAAVSDWDNKTGKYSHGMSKAAFAKACGLPTV